MQLFLYFFYACVDEYSLEGEEIPQGERVQVNPHV
jgi:hypothetical protein